MSESFVETAILIATMDSDMERVDELLEDFSIRELAVFSDQLSLLDERVRSMRRQKTHGRQ